MQRFDFTNKLNAGLENFPGERWAKFNNSWLYLGRRRNKHIYLVAYQACTFVFKPEKSKPWQTIMKGHPGEIGSLWGNIIPKVWNCDSEGNANFPWSGFNQWQAIGIALVSLKHRGQAPDEDFHTMTDAIMNDVMSESSEDSSDASSEEQADALWERPEDEAFDEDGTADMPDQLSESGDDGGPFISDVEVLSDQMFPELINFGHPKLLFDFSKKQIYLTARMLHGARKIKGPHGNNLQERQYTTLRQLECFDDTDKCELQRQFILGPETMTIQGIGPSYLDWPLGGSKFFDLGSLNLLTRKGIRKKSTKPLSHQHPDELFIEMKSQTVTSNIGDFDRRVSYLMFGDNPVGKVSMDGPLLQVPRLDAIPDTEKNVKRYLGVGQLRIKCYEIYYLIEGVISEYFEDKDIDIDDMIFEDKLAHISDACAELGKDKRVFKPLLTNFLDMIFAEAKEYYIPLTLKRWTEEDLSDDISDEIVNELQRCIANEFSAFVFALFKSKREERVVFSDNAGPFIPRRYRHIQAFSGGMHSIGLGDMVLPPQNLCMAFFYDVLIGEGGENSDRPKEAWHHYRFSDAFLLRDEEGIDPYISPTNLAFAPEDTYLMGYGASDHYAKVTSFGQWEIEDMLERRGRPADRMQFKFI